MGGGGGGGVTLCSDCGWPGAGLRSTCMIGRAHAVQTLTVSGFWVPQVGQNMGPPGNGDQSLPEVELSAVGYLFVKCGPKRWGQQPMNMRVSWKCAKIISVRSCAIRVVLVH